MSSPISIAKSLLNPINIVYFDNNYQWLDHSTAVLSLVKGVEMNRYIITLKIGGNEWICWWRLLLELYYSESFCLTITTVVE